jgi:hypothetical protein
MFPGQHGKKTRLYLGVIAEKLLLNPLIQLVTMAVPLCDVTRVHQVSLSMVTSASCNSMLKIPYRPTNIVTLNLGAVLENRPLDATRL